MVFICSPFAGDELNNCIAARKYSRFAFDSGYMPVTPHLLYPQFLDERTERREGIHMGIVLLGKCEEVWVFGSKKSAGMEKEIEVANGWYKTIRYFDEDCQEVTSNA
jgi:hypothetical protein